MLSQQQDTAKQVGAIMAEVYTRIGIDYHVYVTTINQQGIRLA
jgi:homoserine kinase